MLFQNFEHIFLEFRKRLFMTFCMREVLGGGKSIQLGFISKKRRYFPKNFNFKNESKDLHEI